MHFPKLRLSKLHLPRIHLPFRGRKDATPAPSAPPAPLPTFVVTRPSREAPRSGPHWVLRERPLKLHVTNGLSSSSSLDRLGTDKPLPPLPHERDKPLPALPAEAEPGRLGVPQRPSLHHQASEGSIASYNPQVAFFDGGSPEPGQRGQGTAPLRVTNPDSPSSSTESLVPPRIPNFSRPFNAHNPPPTASRPAPPPHPQGTPPQDSLPPRLAPYRPDLDPELPRYSGRLPLNTPGHPKPYRSGLDPESPRYTGEPPAHKPRGPRPPGPAPWGSEPHAL